MFMLTWITSLVLRLVELQDPPYPEQSSLSSTNALGLAASTLMWTGGQPAQCFISASSRSQEAKNSNYVDIVHGEYPPTFLHAVFCTSRNTHPVFRRHQWTYFPCKVFPELSLCLLSPQCCMILSTTVWKEKVFHLFQTLYLIFSLESTQVVILSEKSK